MSRGDWLPFTALAGGLIAGIVAVVLILYAVPIGSEQYRPDTADYQNADANNDQPFPDNLLPPIAIPRIQYAANDEKQYAASFGTDHDGGRHPMD
jgi:hypothetical protein